MKQERNRHGLIPALVGLVLMALGACALSLCGDTMQYAFPAPAPAAEEDVLGTLYRQGQKQLAAIADSLRAYAIGARRQGVSLSAGGARSAQATLYAVGEGYFEVMHETLRDGRLISGTDVQRAGDVIVIDEDTALALFPGVEPVGQKLTLEGLPYEVAGVIRGGRRLGETDAAIAYIPITSAGRNKLAMTSVQAVARGIDAIGSAILMEDAVRSWHAGGSFYSLSKLRLGALMPLRWALLIAGLSVLLALLRRMNALAMGRIARYHSLLRTHYARTLAPGMAASALLCALGYGVLLAAVSALAVFSIRPLYVFTEWVPEVVVELSSLSSRFWSLNDANAAAIRCVTREVCVLELGRGLLRWGFGALLLGVAMHGSRFLGRRVEIPQIRKER